MTTCLGESCSFGLPRVPFVNCCQFMYLVISLLVLRAGCGIWLYQFLIIAYLFTLHIDKIHKNDSSFQLCHQTLIFVIFVDTTAHFRRWRKESSSDITAHGIYRSVKRLLQPIKLREISIKMKSWNYIRMNQGKLGLLKTFIKTHSCTTWRKVKNNFG